MGDILARTPLGRIGAFEELVGPVGFLASDAPNKVTGQTLMVDGGMTIYGFQLMSGGGFRHHLLRYCGHGKVWFRDYTYKPLE